MIAHSEWKRDEVFEGVAENGNTVIFDANAAHTAGPSPMEAVLMALCACTSVDVVSILKKKRQEVAGLRVTAHAARAETAPSVFTHIKLKYAVRGRLSRKRPKLSSCPPLLLTQMSAGQIDKHVLQTRVPCG